MRSSQPDHLLKSTDGVKADRCGNPESVSLIPIVSTRQEIEANWVKDQTNNTEIRREGEAGRRSVYSLESGYKILHNPPLSLIASILQGFRPTVLADTITAIPRQLDARWAGERVFQSEAPRPLLLKYLP